jgi:hypothetical protein
LNQDDLAEAGTMFGGSLALAREIADALITSVALIGLGDVAPAAGRNRLADKASTWRPRADKSKEPLQAPAGV